MKPDLSMYESLVLGAILENQADNLPPNCEQLVNFAPQSFDDQRHGQTAVAIRNLRRDGKSIHAGSVAKMLIFEDAFGFVTQLQRSALDITIAEQEATELLKAYCQRQTIQTLSEAAEDAREHPEHCSIITENAIKALADISSASLVGNVSLHDKLIARAYSQQAKLVEPVPRYCLADVGICTAGNITTISAQAKAGKTAGISAMIASALAEVESNGDFLGFKSSNPKHHAIVTIDTEQTPYDHWKLIERARIRAGLETTPEWLQSFCVTGFNLPEIRAALRVTLEDAFKRFGGIHSFILDGAADVVPDVNDPLESNALVAEIHALAIEFDCPAIAIIHLNPSSDFKTRGHLGSQLERKAETNLRLKKDDNEITTMWCDKNRRAPIPEKTGPRFAWSNLKSMHVSVATVDQCRTTLQAEDSIMKVMEAFRMSGKTGLHYAELIRAIAAVPGVKSESTAERIYSKAKTAGTLTKNIIGQWEISQ